MTSSCSHDVVFHGMCAHCGAAVKEKEDSNGPEVLKKKLVRPGHVSRAEDLLVTRDRARKLGDANAESLKSNGKLCLILDLDHTLVHVCSPSAEQAKNGVTGCGWAHGDGPTGIPDAVKASAKRSNGISGNTTDLPDVATVSTSDATSAAGKTSATGSNSFPGINLPPPPDLPTPPGALSSSKPTFPPDLPHRSSSASPSNDSHHDIPIVVRVPMLTPPHLAAKFRTEQLKENAVYEFYLPLPEASYRATVHWMRIRPGLLQFLEECAENYEIYLYTHGTQTYAETVLAILDPHYRCFGNPHRIFSRDTAGTGAGMKALTAIFPCEHSLAIVVDDRDDVWPPDLPNLIKVSPFRYFPDPGRDRLCIEGWFRLARDLERGVKRSSPGQDSGASAGNSHTSRYAVGDCDRQLPSLISQLKIIRALTFDPSLKTFGDARPAIAMCRSHTLKGFVLVTSGVIPRTHAHIVDHPIRKAILAMGARIDEKVTENTTHVIASRLDTAKVQEALQQNQAFAQAGSRRRIYIVRPQWLENAMATWTRPRENLFEFGRFDCTDIDGDHWWLRCGTKHIDWTRPLESFGPDSIPQNTIATCKEEFTSTRSKADVVQDSAREVDADDLARDLS